MPEPGDGPRDDPGAKNRPKIGRYILAGVLVLGLAAAWGIVDRERSEAELTQWTHRQAIPSVDLVTPQHATESRRLDLPANIEAFYSAPIHSRVNGYVKMWYYDIGARVKAGDVLASIDTPDLDQQYQQAKGEFAKAQADYNLALLTADRWKALRASNAVSQQTADEKTGDAQARKAEVSAAQARLDRVKAMEDFKNIQAPFDGVVTARRIDVGALVSATDSNAKSLFDISSIQQVRVYVSVPQIDAAPMHEGLKVTLTLPQFPGRAFAGTVTTTSDAIAAGSRALLVEAVLPNPGGLLKPGSYAQAHFELPLNPHELVVPSSAMIFRRDAPELAVVNDGKVALQPIKILMDLGDTIEVTGITDADTIVKSPSDSIQNGETVRVETIDGHPAGAKLQSKGSGEPDLRQEAKK